jgi:predicted nicotinamide N-methyase
MTRPANRHPSIVERVAVAGRDWTLWRPPSAEDLIDEDAYARDERLPYWAELWPSGQVLAEELALRHLAGARVLELGCGLGLPSLVAAGRGARVTATDWYTEALNYARRNAAEAGLEIDTALLDWFRPAPELLAAAPFDLVIGADVLYEDRNGEALEALLPRLVAPTGEALVTDPRRPNAATLLKPLRARGWEVTTREVEHRMRPDESGPIVHLHRLVPPTA